MKLIYCYIEKFRNIHHQKVSLSDKFKCLYEDGILLIEKSNDNSLADYIYKISCVISELLGNRGTGSCFR